MDERSPSPLPGFDGVDFEHYVFMDDELVACVEPDPEDSEQHDNPSDDETEK